MRESTTLLKEIARHLGWRYPAFVVSISIIASVSLLPAAFFRFFTEQIFLVSSSSQIAGRIVMHGTAIAFVLLLSRTANALLQETLRLNLETYLRRRILWCLHRIPLPRLENAQRGDWYTRITADLSRVESFLTDSLPSQLRMLTILIGTAAIFAVQSGWLVIFPLSSALVVAFVNFRVQRVLAPRLRELREGHASAFQDLIENFEGIRTIRSQRAESFIAERFEGKLQELRKKSLSVVTTVGKLLGSNEAVSQVFITVCLSFIAFQVSESSLSPQEALSYPFFLGLFYHAAQDLAKNAYDWNRFHIEGGRLSQLFENPQEVQVDVAIPRGNSLEISGLRIGFEEKSLSSPSQFSLRCGQMVTIGGTSGCGKSTFLEVLAGLRSALSGTFSVDGVEHSLVSRGTSLRSLTALVEQRPYLFEGPLSDNLTLGKKYSEQALWNALELACVSDFANERDGVRTHISDRGENLSEGQRYRIALARAILLERPFLLLDEPFAALDEKAVDSVAAMLNRAKEHRGILIVTHKIPSTLDVDFDLNFDFSVKQNPDFRSNAIEGG